MDSKEKGIEALGKIKEILDRHSIEYWLDEGTLLGAVREKKLIEWDHDIDLSIWYKDLSKITPLFDEIRRTGLEVIFFEWKKHIKLLGEGYEIDINLYHLKDKNATRIWHVNNQLGRILDYFIWTIYLKNPRSRKLFAPFFITKNLVKISNKWPDWMNKKNLKLLLKIYEKKGCKFFQVAMPSHYFTELTTLEFYKMNFKVPKKTEEYLEYRYGKNWRIPKKDYVWYKDDQSVIK